MKEKKDSILPFFYLGGDVLLALLANIGILSYALGSLPRNIDFLVLGFLVLGIYLLDRSYDSLQEFETNKTSRGRFYFHKTKFTAAIGAFFLLLSLTLAIFFYELNFFLGGLLLAVFVLIYLLLSYFQKSSFFPKEFLVALLYTLGAAYPIFFYRPWKETTDLLIYILFFLSIFVEVMLLSVEDWEWDQKHSRSSLALQLGRTKTKYLIAAIGCVGFVLACVALFQAERLRNIGIGYGVYFLMIGQIPKVFKNSSSEVRKVNLELSYFPFLVYYFL